MRDIEGVLYDVGGFRGCGGAGSKDAGGGGGNFDELANLVKSGGMG